MKLWMIVMKSRSKGSAVTVRLNDNGYILMTGDDFPQGLPGSPGNSGPPGKEGPAVSKIFKFYKLSAPLLSYLLK